MNFFATARELKLASRENARLAKDKTYWHDRALSLEKKLEERDAIHREHNLALMDRFLTGVVKTYAVADQVKAEVKSKKPDPDFFTTKQLFLKDKREQMIEWALEAGETETDAERRYEENLLEYELEFESQFERMV